MNGVDMLIDPVAAAGLTAREVRSASRAGVPTKIAVAARIYPAGQEDLWDAVTSADRIPRWFLPISGDLEVGGRYQLEGNAGGVIERCDRPTSFAVTWEYGGMVSWLEVTLTRDGEGTRLELVHEAEVDPDVWAQFGPGAVGLGWDLGLLGLGLHIESGAPVDPELAATFNFLPEGVEFIRLAAAGWADAAIGDGEDSGEAREAADRSVAAYTTLPEAAPDSPARPAPES
jgi:uncharacterized protein YndB with AHSA1/START domain